MSSAPSVHPSGAIYSWSKTGATAFASAPEWLVEKLVRTRNGKTLEQWHDIITNTISEGQRNATLASITGKLLFHGVHPYLVRDLVDAVNVARCSPPLPPNEVEQLVASVMHTDAEKRR
jgi:primase-like protein